ncbi:MAG TPA: hypothetical protein DD670_08365 [Planctomycetaceae bacterium]|nr:hypothetical protein [Planctomycetaceae bacterium]
MHGTTTENIKVRVYNWIDNVLQLAADRTILVSHSQRRRVFGGRNEARVHVLHNAVDVDNPMPCSAEAPSLRGRFSIPNGNPIVIAVARLNPEKGIDVLIDAFAILAEQLSNVHLVLVGDGQERRRLEKQCQKRQLNGRVHFAGYSAMPGDLVAEADVLALSSRSEGLPNVVLEAMAMGKPVVATTVGGVPEVIEDGISGRLVPPDQPDLLARALAELCTTPDLRKRLAASGRLRVQEAFSIEGRAAKLQSLYQHLL